MAGIRRHLRYGPILALVAVLAAGCASERAELPSGAADLRLSRPVVPIFLTGPVGVLLTNSPGFSAHVSLQTAPGDGNELANSGELLSRGTQLLFTPQQIASGKGRSGGYSFAWDVAQCRGWVLSETLQAYAPLVLSTRLTNMIIHPETAPLRNIAGHSCAEQEVTAQLSDGSNILFQILRATDLNGLPVQISCQASSKPFTLKLSKIRLEAPPLELTTVPDGFTKYNSPEALADELLNRLHDLNRRQPTTPEVLYQTPTRRY